MDRHSRITTISSLHSDQNRRTAVSTRRRERPCCLGHRPPHCTTRSPTHCCSPHLFWDLERGASWIWNVAHLLGILGKSYNGSGARQKRESERLERKLKEEAFHFLGWRKLKAGSERCKGILVGQVFKGGRDKLHMLMDWTDYVDWTGAKKKDFFL